MKKQFAIISHDRHRDDYVYIFNNGESVEECIEKIWIKDFGSHRNDTSGSYTVEEAIIKTLNPTQ
jgi:hypothetical protein